MPKKSVYVTDEVFKELKRLVAVRKKKNPLLDCIPSDIIAILLHKYASDIETMTNNNIGKKEEKE
jgi:hypothetical protein